MSCHCHECAPMSEKEKIEKEDRRHLFFTIARLSVSFVLALLGLFLFTEEWGDAHFGNGAGLWLNFAIMALAWLASGYDIVIEGFESCIKEKNPFDENVLMFVASGNDARDAAAAAAYTELMAAELGLGCLYSGYFTACCAGSREIQAMLGLAPDEQVVRCLVLGHPDVKFRRTAPRKPVSLTEL